MLERTRGEVEEPQRARLALTAGGCDCGFDFETNTLRDSYLPALVVMKERLRRTGKRTMVAGAAWCTGGIILSVPITLFYLQMGGVWADRKIHIAAGGMILIGTLQFIRGLRRYRQGLS